MLDENKPMIITISRQLGSGGSYIGQGIAQRLGLRYVDREILSNAAEHLKEDEERLVFREEKVTGLMERILTSFIYGTPETPYVPPPIKSIYDPELFETEARIIRQIADAGSAVIIGRAGFNILKGRGHALNVFIHASDEFRTARVMDLYGISNTDEALNRIKESDSQRRRFIKSVTNSEWTDARNYHLSIDASAAGLSAAENIIIELAERIK